MRRLTSYSASWFARGLGAARVVIVGRTNGCLTKPWPASTNLRWKSSEAGEERQDDGGEGKSSGEQVNQVPFSAAGGVGAFVKNLILSQQQQQQHLSLSDNTAETSAEHELLSAEQRELIDLILTGRNVFYTGAAGTGKSTVLRAAVKSLRRRGLRVDVVAPTGRAALNVNGTTTWSYAGWSPKAHARPLETLCRWAISESNVRRFADTDVLIIDEVSMVENHHLERLNQVMREARGHASWDKGFNHVERIRHSAFGGCQVIVTGDFFQLPPVLPFQHCIQCGSQLLKEIRPGETTHRCPSGHGNWPDTYKWAFQSYAWDDADFAHVELKQVHRQADDPLFINILNRFRSGKFTYDDIMILANPKRETASMENATRLYPTRVEVAQHNAEKARKLKTQPYDFIAQDEFAWNASSHPHLERHGERQADGTLVVLKEHRYEPFLRLKVGMPVVLLSNINIGRGLVNGSQGVIVDFDSVDPVDLFLKRQSLYRTGQEKRIAKDELYKYAKKVGHFRVPLPIVKFDNGEKTTIYPECSIHEISNDVISENTDLDIYSQDVDTFLKRSDPSMICRTQIPLVAGWAMSIHKAQGMTLGKVIVDLTRAFAEGQVYVALSRAKTLAGLKIEGDPRGLLVRRDGNREVREFYQERFGEKPAKESEVVAYNVRN